MDVRLLDPAIEDGSYLWLIELGGCQVGVQARQGWCLRLDDQVVTLDDMRRFVPLGPLLDVASPKLSAFLKSAAIAHPAFEHHINQFPKEMLLKHVFQTSYSGYWPERALAWLEADRDLLPGLTTELQQFVENTVMPQGARQRARQMLRQKKLM